MSEDPIYTEPMRQLIISMSAWRRLNVNGDLLEVFDEGGENLIARIDLKHYLKVTVVW